MMKEDFYYSLEMMEDGACDLYGLQSFVIT